MGTEGVVGRGHGSLILAWSLRQYACGPGGQFLLDPDVVFLNHGSFGACPGPCSSATRSGSASSSGIRSSSSARRSEGLLEEARGGSPGTSARRRGLVFVPNATTGEHGRSLARLAPGDEVLTTDRVRRRRSPGSAGARSCGRRSSRLGRVTGRHASSPSGTSPRRRLVVPVEELCARAREGRLAVVDGAHGPGHVPIDLAASARTSTRATPTSGCARRRARAFSGRGRS